MKRSPIKRKRTTKRRTTSPRCSNRQCNKPAKVVGMCAKHAMWRADKLARAIVMERDGGCRAGTHLWLDSEGRSILKPCQGPLQWCHVWSRSYHAIRHDPRNAIVMCAGHHSFMTHNPAAWEQWCRDHGIAWDELRIEALERGPSWSLAEELDRLAKSVELEGDSNP